MKTRATLGAGLLMAWCVAPAFAADPPTTGAPQPQIIEPETMTPDAALEMARELRKRADAGDADAAWNFFRLLVHFAPLGDRSDGQHSAEWFELKDHRSDSDWLLRAAELGSQTAIYAVCGLGEDRLAPADLRERSAARCQELRAKFPAK